MIPSCMLCTLLSVRLWASPERDVERGEERSRIGSLRDDDQVASLGQRAGVRVQTRTSHCSVPINRLEVHGRRLFSLLDLAKSF
jgi:hypothetical protein